MKKLRQLNLLQPLRKLPGSYGCLLLAAALTFVSTAHAAPAATASARVPVRLASGAVDNPGSASAVVYSEVLDLGPEAPWVRVFFAETHLPAGSAVRVTSLRDRESQTLNARHLAQWSSSTGYFNGSRVRVELLGGPGSQGNLVRIDEVLVGRPPEPDPNRSICGLNDDRVLSSEPAVGRLMTGLLPGPLGGGCTGFIVDCPDGTDDKCHLSAGHCFFAGSGPHQASTVIEFEVPASEADCDLSHPPMAKQFAIDTSSAVGTNQGIGNDWAVFRVFPNPTTGRTTFQEQGAAYPLAASAPAGGTVRVTGFGVDANAGAAGGSNAACATCAPANASGQRHQVQQTHSGAIVSRGVSDVAYEVDSCGGDSGAPVILGTTGQIVAIHTHGGCNTPSGTNSGTAIDYQPLQDALMKCAPHLLVLLDRTGSMAVTRPSTGNTRCADALALAKQDVSDFFAQHPEAEGSSASVWTFADSAPTDLTGGFVDETAALAALNALSPVGCSGQTPLAEAICASSDALQVEFTGTPAGKILAISSDGEENNSDGPCFGPSSVAGPPNYDPGSWQALVRAKVLSQNIAFTRFWGTVVRVGFDSETGEARGSGVPDSDFFADLAGATGGIYQAVGDGGPLPPPFFGGGPVIPIVAVPTLEGWGLLALVLALGVAGLLLLMRARR